MSQRSAKARAHYIVSRLIREALDRPNGITFMTGGEKRDLVEGELLEIRDKMEERYLRLDTSPASRAKRFNQKFDAERKEPTP